MKVLVATPTFDGQVSAGYLLSLLATKERVDFDLLLVPGIHFVDQARDMAAAKFLSSGCDYLFFIDSDLEWNPDDFVRVLNSGRLICGGGYRVKHDQEAYPEYGIIKKENGLFQVKMLPGGFICIHRNVIQSLWESTPHYQTVMGGQFKEVAAMFYREIHDGRMVSEDAMFSRRAAGFGLWLDPDITFGHCGTKTWRGNFSKHLGEPNALPD